jgi:hypothetical protein
MEATIEISIGNHKYVPSGNFERALWITAHGVPPDVKVKVTASVLVWARCGANVEHDGSVRLFDSYGSVANTANGIAYRFLVERACARLMLGEKDVSLAEADVLLAAEAVEEWQREQAAKEAAEAAEALAKKEARVTSIRETGIDSILRRRNGVWETTNDSYDAREVLYQALGKDAYDRAEKEAEKRNAATREPYLEAIRTVATSIDTLARPTAEGYDVENAVLDTLANRMVSFVGLTNTAQYRVRRTASHGMKERQAPSTAAFQVYDMVVQGASCANDAVPNAIGKWKVSRIVRIDTCLHHGYRHDVTATLATLTTPYAEREIVFSHESLACTHDDDDDTDDSDD